MINKKIRNEIKKVITGITVAALMFNAVVLPTFGAEANTQEVIVTEEDTRDESLASEHDHSATMEGEVDKEEALVIPEEALEEIAKEAEAQNREKNVEQNVEQNPEMFGLTDYSSYEGISIATYSTATTMTGSKLTWSLDDYTWMALPSGWNVFDVQNCSCGNKLIGVQGNGYYAILHGYEGLTSTTQYHYYKFNVNLSTGVTKSITGSGVQSGTATSFSIASTSDYTRTRALMAFSDGTFYVGIDEEYATTSYWKPTSNGGRTLNPTMYYNGTAIATSATHYWANAFRLTDSSTYQTSPTHTIQLISPTETYVTSGTKGDGHIVSNINTTITTLPEESPLGAEIKGWYYDSTMIVPCDITLHLRRLNQVLYGVPR